MPSARYSVWYYYYSPDGKGGKTGASHAGSVSTKSDTLVMQQLRKKHPGKEIEFRDLKWLS